MSKKIKRIRGRPTKYPYSKWLDPEKRKKIPFSLFDITPKSMTALLHKQIRKNNLLIGVYMMEDYILCCPHHLSATKQLKPRGKSNV